MSQNRSHKLESVVGTATTRSGVVCVCVRVWVSGWGEGEGEGTTTRLPLAKVSVAHLCTHSFPYLTYPYLSPLHRTPRTRAPRPSPPASLLPPHSGLAAPARYLANLRPISHLSDSDRCEILSQIRNPRFSQQNQGPENVAGLQPRTADRALWRNSCGSDTPQARWTEVSGQTSVGKFLEDTSQKARWTKLSGQTSVGKVLEDTSKK